jgi:hypothetical protein
VNLYCDRHDRVHQFTAGQVELIVYSLTCATAAAQCEPDGDRIDAGKDAMDNMPCPVEYLEMAKSIEGFAEVVETWVEARRDASRGEQQ